MTEAEIREMLDNNKRLFEEIARMKEKERKKRK